MGMPKALVRDADGTSWLQRSVAVLVDGGCDAVTVVLGARAEEARQLVPGDVTVVVADDWTDGMSASLRAGLAAVAAAVGSATALVLSLVDLPDVTAEVVRRVAAGAGQTTLARATYAGQPGHPVVIGRDHWAGVAATATGDQGAKPYLSAREVALVECADLATGRDQDTRDPAAEELVVLLDDAGRAIGSAAKSTVHHTSTPLHLAFSCYVFDDSDRLLITQRALTKKTFPGVWTNTVCGHPAPGEDLSDAVRRRARQELGIELSDVELVLPAFRYTATMASGLLENEMCPVYTARTTDSPRPDAAEVEAADWVHWPTFSQEVLSGRREVSIWCRLQVAALVESGTGGVSFAPAARGELPEAAHTW
jgi:isopentenyl-diphosphate delta-isomerase